MQSSLVIYQLVYKTTFENGIYKSNSLPSGIRWTLREKKRILHGNKAVCIPTQINIVVIQYILNLEYRHICPVSRKIRPTPSKQQLLAYRPVVSAIVGYVTASPTSSLALRQCLLANHPSVHWKKTDRNLS